MVGLYEAQPEKFLGKTEFILNNHDPNFSTPLQLHLPSDDAKMDDSTELLKVKVFAARKHGRNLKKILHLTCDAWCVIMLQARQMWMCWGLSH